MPHVTFHGAKLTGFRFTPGPKKGSGAPIIIAEFSAPWSNANRKAGGWEDIPATVSGNIALVPGSLAATHFELTLGQGLEKNGVSLDALEASHFTLFVPKGDDEEKRIDFQISSGSIKAGKTLDTFGRTHVNATGKLRISYDEPADVPAEQGSLLDDERRKATSESED